MAVKTDLEISSVKYKDKYGHTTEIPVKSGGEDMLQARVDETNSCGYLFYGYKGKSLDFIDKLDTSNATTMNYMFAETDLTSLSIPKTFNTDKVTVMQYMFNNSNDLVSIVFPETFNTSRVSMMNYMFSGCSKLESVDLSGFNTNLVSSTNGIGMNSIFLNCRALKSVVFPAKFGSKKVTSYANLFNGCSSLVNVDISSFVMDNISDISSMFKECSLLENIIGELNVINVTSFSQTFYKCTNLKSITLKNIKKTALTIGSGTSYGTLLTLDTLINTIKELWDYSSGTSTYTLTMSTPSKTALADVYVKLITPTAEQIEADPNIVNKMPCEVCESTDEGAMLITDYATLKKWTIK